MRQLRRIPVILEALKDKENKIKVLEYWFTPPKGVELKTGSPFNNIHNIIQAWEKEEEVIAAFWKENTDLRLPQVLISSGIMPNYSGFYFYKEDEATMTLAGVMELKDIIFWGNNYDANRNPLPETRWVLASEMTTGHLEAIIGLVNQGKMRVPDTYLGVFKEELKTRRK